MYVRVLKLFLINISVAYAPPLHNTLKFFSNVTQTTDFAQHIIKVLIHNKFLVNASFSRMAIVMATIGTFRWYFTAYW